MSQLHKYLYRTLFMMYKIGVINKYKTRVINKYKINGRELNRREINRLNNISKKYIFTIS